MKWLSTGRSVPFRVWVITIGSYISPFLLDEATGKNELIWFIYLLPSFFFSYYFGLRGGIITALISTIFHTTWEFILSVMNKEAYNIENFYVAGIVSMISFMIAIGIGLLADKLKHQQAELEKANLRLEELAIKDGLTGLFNRRYMEKCLIEELNRYKTEHDPFSILVIDIDYFKIYNDTNGHLAGDNLLVQLASVLNRNVRPYDVVSRWGGEEFVVLLRRTSSGMAFEVAEQLRKAVMSNKQATVSIGVATYMDESISEIELFLMADQALYRAKERKNCTVIGK